MALDKIVDSSVLDAGLKTIADAIREKGGTSSALAFPGGMAEAIAAIQAGGGGAPVIEKGTFTLSESAKTHVIEHGLGAVPKAVIIYAKNDIDHDASNNHYIAFVHVDGDGVKISTRRAAGMTNAPHRNTITGLTYVDGLTRKGTVSVTFNGNHGDTYILAGVTYRYIIMGW